MSQRTFDDIESGECHYLGSFEATEAEMLRFAERYDPASYHVDPDAAEDSIYGGLIASGWYTASACMELVADEFLSNTRNMGSFGLDELRWPTPVRPGDTISVQIEIVDLTPSTCRSDRGYVVIEVTGTNQDGETVIFWRATNIFGR